MGLPPDTPLLLVVRVRKAGDLPLAVMRNWLHRPTATSVASKLEKDGLYAVLRDRGVRPWWPTRRIEPARPPPPSAATSSYGRHNPS